MHFEENIQKAVDNCIPERPATGVFRCTFVYDSRFPDARENVKLAAQMLAIFGNFLMEEAHRTLRSCEPDAEGLEVPSLTADEMAFYRDERNKPAGTKILLFPGVKLDPPASQISGPGPSPAAAPASES